MRRSCVTTLIAGLVVLIAPAAAPACVKTVAFKGSVRTAEYSGGGALGKRSLKVGDAVSGNRLTIGSTYYVPKGKAVAIRFGRYTSRASGGTAFLPQCDIWTGKDIYFRLLEGKVRMSGPAIPGGANGSPSGSYVVTPDATVLPLPGRPTYTAKRTVSNKASTTRTSVKSVRGGSNLFVKISALAARGKKIPCQAGGKVTVFGNGKYRNG